MAADTEKQLAWEARWRPRAAAACLAAAFFTLGAGIAAAIVFADAPRGWLADALSRAAQPGPVGESESLRVGLYQFYDDHAAGLIGVALGQALGLLALGFALTVLGMATRARREAFPRIALYVPFVGAALSGVAAILSNVGNLVSVGEFLDGSRTVASAEDVSSDSLLVTGQLLSLAGGLALATGYVLVTLNAMRAGLLTRFMGVLGIIVGVLVIFPLGSPLPIVQSFWLVALAVLFAGRWPGVEPPAWRTGREEPWPSSAELREARRSGQQARGERKGGRRPPPPDEPAPVAAGAAQAQARKRKRKRRR